MEVAIFNKNNSELYIDLLNEKGLELDIYYYPEFLRIFAQLEKGEFEIFTLHSATEIFIYPYIKIENQHLGEHFYSITSPYGYGGPYSTNEMMLKKGENHFLEYNNSKCISEFIRYHYLYSKDKLFKQNISNTQNRTVVVLDLKQGWESIWTNQFSGTNRNLCRKLENEGFNFELHYDMKYKDEFVKLYFKTMDNIGAGEYYYFNDQFFDQLFSILFSSKRMILARVTKDDTTFCSALFFISGGILTYFFVCTKFRLP